MENLIEVMFLEISQTNEYNKTPEVKEICKVTRKNDGIIETILGTETYLKIEDLINEQNAITERKCFSLGFKTAMKLLAESGFSVPKVVSV